MDYGGTDGASSLFRSLHGFGVAGFGQPSGRRGGGPGNRGRGALCGVGVGSVCHQRDDDH